MKKAVWIWFGILAVAFSAMIPPAVAQDNYPSAPVRLIWGFVPGASGDLIARLLAQKLSKQMNASVIVENKPGASGNIGAEFVAKSKPDGYTLLFNPSTVTVSPALGEKLGYDLLKDLAPVALVATAQHLIVVHPSMAANTLAEFIAYGRANPNKLTYGSSGTGGFSHLSTLLFLQSNGMAAVHVPYKGNAPVFLDLVAGRIQFAFGDMGTTLPLVKDKRLRALAITSLKRSPLVPDVPAAAETMPGFEIGNWYGVMAPAKTPRPLVLRLNSELVKVLQDPDLVALFQDRGLTPLLSTPEEFENLLRSELERWSKVIKSAGVKVE